MALATNVPIDAADIENNDEEEGDLAPWEDSPEYKAQVYIIFTQRGYAYVGYTILNGTSIKTLQDVLNHWLTRWKEYLGKKGPYHRVFKVFNGDSSGGGFESIQIELMQTYDTEDPLVLRSHATRWAKEAEKKYPHRVANFLKEHEKTPKKYRYELTSEQQIDQIVADENKKKNATPKPKKANVHMPVPKKPKVSKWIGQGKGDQKEEDFSLLGPPSPKAAAPKKKKKKPSNAVLFEEEKEEKGVPTPVPSYYNKYYNMLLNQMAAQPPPLVPPIAPAAPKPILKKKKKKLPGSLGYKGVVHRKKKKKVHFGIAARLLNQKKIEDDQMPPLVPPGGVWPPPRPASPEVDNPYEGMDFNLDPSAYPTLPPSGPPQPPLPILPPPAPSAGTTVVVDDAQDQGFDMDEVMNNFDTYLPPAVPVGVGLGGVVPGDIKSALDLKHLPTPPVAPPVAPVDAAQNDEGYIFDLNIDNHLVPPAPAPPKKKWFQMDIEQKNYNSPFHKFKNLQPKKKKPLGPPVSGRPMSKETFNKLKGYPKKKKWFQLTPAQEDFKLHHPSGKIPVAEQKKIATKRKRENGYKTKRKPRLTVTKKGGHKAKYARR